VVRAAPARNHYLWLFFPQEKMMKNIGLALMGLLALLCFATPAFAQTTGAPLSGPSVGAGLVLLGAGLGFGKIGSAALEGMARQPEVANKIQPAMIIIAALLEGATFFALLVCMIKDV
jgi:F-type H+-transporting ATPase subunit c